LLRGRNVIRNRSAGWLVFIAEMLGQPSTFRRNRKAQGDSLRDGADGTVGFNAFGTISYNPATRVYTLHSYAMGNVGDFALNRTADGYTWEIPAGPMTIRYTAVIKDGTWREVGDRIVPGKDPVRFFEMILKRVGDTNWPGAGAISPK